MQKRIILIISFSIVFTSTAFMQNKSLTYLALGDSYTIGESVPSEKNFPNQTVALLRKEKIDIEDPSIIATTGWTTDELQDQLSRVRLRVPFDFVTLLIGVNNQYRGRSTTEYATQFTELLEQAIAYAGGNASHVIVLSIPDWSVTPFAKSKDQKKIANEIDAFNAINEKISRQYKVHYINITTSTREATKDKTLVAKDGLHPSAKEYTKWAVKLKEVMMKELI
jgi:lysophospholipase L1-like esterase